MLSWKGNILQIKFPFLHLIAHKPSWLFNAKVVVVVVVVLSNPQMRDKQIRAFRSGISKKVNIEAPLEFELAY